MIQPFNRRKFLGRGAQAAGALVLTTGAIRQALASACGITPVQTPGPFYPGEANFHPDHDLTFIPGHPERAKGQIIYIQGQVLDSSCKPISGVNVEIWQACATGKYNNAKDDNPAILDPHFKYWGEVLTDQEGRYVFKTILPGAYPADTDWTRPPHIHFKLSKLGYEELVTQMYFKGNALNEEDLIFQKLSPVEQARVIVGFVPSSPNFEPGSWKGTFDITLTSVRRA